MGGWDGMEMAEVVWWPVIVSGGMAGLWSQSAATFGIGLGVLGCWVQNLGAEIGTRPRAYSG